MPRTGSKGRSLEDVTTNNPRGSRAIARHMPTILVAGFSDAGENYP